MKNEVAKKANISVRFLDMLLSGARNPSIKTSILLEEITNIPKEIWVFGSPAEKREAFNALKEVKPAL